MYHLYKWTPPSLGRNTITRHYEPMQPHLLMALARHFKCETFLDVGANIGAYSLLMSGVAPITSIHAFEASPETFEHLKQNALLNGADIHIYNLAASDARGVLKFGIVNMLSGANSVIDSSIHSRFERQVEVEAAPLDEVVDVHGQRVCIKIDVEGHEPQVLAGMVNILKRNEVVLQIEDFNSEPKEMERRLERHDFEQMFRVGSDRYFTNIKPVPSDVELVNIFQAAAEELVQTNLGALYQSYVDGEAPLDIPLGLSMTLQLRGKSASLARSMRRLLRPAINRIRRPNA